MGDLLWYGIHDRRCDSHDKERDDLLSSSLRSKTFHLLLNIGNISYRHAHDD